MREPYEYSYYKELSKLIATESRLQNNLNSFVRLYKKKMNSMLMHES